MYINLHLLLFNFAYLLFLSFVSFLPSQHICQFCFHCFIHQLAPLFSSLCFSQFCFGRYNFWFPLFAGSIYCFLLLLLLDCFDFAYGCICMCVYSVTFYCYYKPLHLHWAFAVLWSFPFFPFFSSFRFFKSFLFFYNFNFFKPIIFFLHYSFVCLSYCSFLLAAAAVAEATWLQSYLTLCDPTDGSPPGSSVPGILRQEHQSGLPFLPPFPLQLIFNIYKSSSSTSI